MTKARSGDGKRHCMIVHAYYPLGETRVQREAEALIRRGYQVDVLCLRKRNEVATESFHSVRVIRLPVRRRFLGWPGSRFFEYLRFFLFSMVTVARLHRQQPYDTIQVHNLPDFLVFCAIIPKLGGVPVILDLHDLMPEFYACRFGKNAKTLTGRLIRWQERLSCRFADHVITVSEHWRQALIARGVPAHKCSVVMNVADDHIFYPQEGDDGCPFDGSQLRMIYHGTLVDRYGLDLAIRAVDQVKHEIPNVHLTLLGAGSDVPKLQQLIQELDLADYVTLRNEIRPAEELPAIIRAADLGIVPYQNDVFTDGLLPTKLMEYAALGLPSIAARTSAIEATFSDAMVEFFEPGNVDDLVRCIRMLYSKPERLAELRKGSAKFNQRFNWATTSAQYVALVERLGSRQESR